MNHPASPRRRTGRIVAITIAAVLAILCLGGIGIAALLASGDNTTTDEPLTAVTPAGGTGTAPTTKPAAAATTITGDGTYLIPTEIKPGTRKCVMGILIGAFAVTVIGRPAPQGSKRLGAAGQIREQSAYLPAWRAAVKRAVYERYRELGITPADLPLFVGPVWARVWFSLDTGDRADGPPDLDKLLRSTWDALTEARVWEDDARVVHVEAGKSTGEAPPGAHIVIRPVYVHHGDEAMGP